MLMFCKYCGLSVQEDDHFCKYCGKEINKKNDSVEQKSEEQCFKKDNDLLFIKQERKFILFGIVVLILYILIFKFLKNHIPTDPKPMQDNIIDGVYYLDGNYQ